MAICKIRTNNNFFNSLIYDVVNISIFFNHKKSALKQWKLHEIDYLPGEDLVVPVSISVLISVLVSVPDKSVVTVDAIGSPKTSI